MTKDHKEHADKKKTIKHYSDSPKYPVINFIINQNTRQVAETKSHYETENKNEQKEDSVSSCLKSLFRCGKPM